MQPILKQGLFTSFLKFNLKHLSLCNLLCRMSNLKGIKMKTIWHLQIQIYLGEELQLSVHTNKSSSLSCILVLKFTLNYSGDKTEGKLLDLKAIILHGFHTKIFNKNLQVGFV